MVPPKQARSSNSDLGELTASLQDGTGLSTGAKLGIVAACCIGGMLLAFTIFFRCWSRKQKKARARRKARLGKVAHTPIAGLDRPPNVAGTPQHHRRFHGGEYKKPPDHESDFKMPHILPSLLYGVGEEGKGASSDVESRVLDLGKRVLSKSVDSPYQRTDEGLELSDVASWAENVWQNSRTTDSVILQTEASTIFETDMSRRSETASEVADRLNHVEWLFQACSRYTERFGPNIKVLDSPERMLSPHKGNAREVMALPTLKEQVRNLHKHYRDNAKSVPTLDPPTPPFFNVPNSPHDRASRSVHAKYKQHDLQVPGHVYEQLRLHTSAEHDDQNDVFQSQPFPTTTLLQTPTSQRSKPSYQDMGKLLNVDTEDGNIANSETGFSAPRFPRSVVMSDLMTELSFDPFKVANRNRAKAKAIAQARARNIIAAKRAGKPRRMI